MQHRVMVRETGEHWEVKWTGFTIISEGTELLELPHIENEKIAFELF